MAEDYTTYTEVDPNDRYVVDSATQITVTGVTRNEDAYIYDDKGAGDFGATFEHDFDMKITAVVGLGWCTGWGVANEIGNIGVDIKQSLIATIHRSYAILFTNNEIWDQGTYGCSVNTWYYCTVERTSGTNCDMRIYSDPGRTNLLVTLNLSLTSDRTYRYIYAACSAVSGFPDMTISGVFANLNLNEGVVYQVFYASKPSVFTAAKPAASLARKERCVAVGA